MSDRLTDRTARVVLLQAVIVVIVFGVVGAACGLLWYHLWTPPHGVVAGKVWYADETGLRREFGGTGWYAVVASVAGLVLGLLTAWLFDRSEVATLVAVAVGSVLAGWLMLRVGLHFSPADPTVLARHTADGKSLPGNLTVSGASPKLCFPIGALVGLAVIYLLTNRRRPRSARGAADPSSNPAANSTPLGSPGWPNSG